MTATVLHLRPTAPPAARRDEREIKALEGAAAMAEPTVGAGYARGLLEFAVSKGAGRLALLERSGVKAADLQDQDARIPFRQYVALMRAGQALSGDSALALHYGERVDIAEVSIIGLIGQASETMAEAFAQLNRYVRLVVETDNEGGGDRFGMTFDRGGLWMVDNRRRADDFPELTESAFAQLVCGPRRMGVPQMVKAVHVTHAAPPHRDEYERIFQAPVVFESDRNGLLLDHTLADPTVARLPRYVFGVLTEHADELLKSLESSKSVRGRVESLLMPVLHTGHASMDAVAARLGISRQTLFRKLKAEGVTFATVLDELRHRMAADYLGARKVSVNETAYLVGFSEPAAFSRAFKRWTGSSPRAMRAAGL
ncbi:AraC family transcriptional regulator [Phenylobacterium sp.]|uniref:AraC family transcriptional regulator n=1 Tax=Phenylobacterium sp. TaxID=1871053 RepID=UPI003568DD91